MRLWLLERAPMWTRSRWPLRRFYWQADAMARIDDRVAEMRRSLGGGG